MHQWRIMATSKKQISSDNPGWKGMGIPSLRRLTISQTPVLLRSLRQRRFQECLNLIRSPLSNLWNFYGGGRFSHRVTCPYCKWSGPGFIATSNWRDVTFQSRCPRCDSRSRHRGLAALLPSLSKQLHDGRILVFAPEEIILELIQTQAKDKVYRIS